MRGSCEPVRIDIISDMECSHVDDAVQYSDVELSVIKAEGRCSNHYQCDFRGKNVWLCLAVDCKFVLCGGSTSKSQDHAEAHYRENPSHMVCQNLENGRLWCYVCKMEIHFPPLDDGKPKGLQNTGNTCYMNSALQALLNLPAIREHFTQAYILSSSDDDKHLSRNFQRLIEDMCECSASSASYLKPKGILNGIRNMHPMFRGYHQHDTQEFLRCFMDLLHDELKEQITSTPHNIPSPPHQPEDEKFPPEEDARGDQSEASNSSGNQSDYETADADSGVDEGDRISAYRKHSSNSSPIPRSKLLSKSSSFRGPNSPNKLKRKPPKYRSIISDLFDGKLLSSVKCLSCEQVSTRVETFQDLSLPIPSRDHVTMLHQKSDMLPREQATIIFNQLMNAQDTLGHTMSLSQQNMAIAVCADVYKGKPTWVSWLWEWVKSWFWGPTVSLHDCLAAFFSADELKGDNMYSCEKCSLLRNGKKFSQVMELPEVLCIHLKRFRHELAFSSKISNFVSFPLTDLDMRPHLNTECKSKVTSYDLSSVICHHGTAGSGHYTCYAINHRTGLWYELDDQCVTQVSPETVANCEGYVLFYSKKKSEKINKVNDKVSKMRRAENLEKSLYVSQRWWRRLSTFAEPGPIDNSDFLCPHGYVQPPKMSVIDKLAMPISRDVWEYLYQEFGGGPSCMNIFQCPVCEDELTRMKNRVKMERSQYLVLQEDNKPDDCQSVMYAVSVFWYRQWEAFVQGNANEPPGPIDNTPIATIVNGQKVVKPGSDYVPLAQELWCFFWNIYGGGPELTIKPPARVPSRASFSSGISVERERDRISNYASKAKSVESLPVDMSRGGGDGQTRAVRTHSVSSDNVKIKISAAIASHRKQQSFGSMRLERAIKFEGDQDNQRKEEELSESKENDYCPAFTPDELDSYVPFEAAESRLI